MGVLLTYDEKIDATKKIISLIGGSTKSVQKISKVKLGVIGAGNYASAVFLPAVKKTGNVSFIGITSPGGTNARNLGNKYGFQFAASDENEILSNKEINTIAVLSRHNSHAPLTLEALNQERTFIVKNHWL